MTNPEEKAKTKYAWYADRSDSLAHLCEVTDTGLRIRSLCNVQPRQPAPATGNRRCKNCLTVGQSMKALGHLSDEV